MTHQLLTANRLQDGEVVYLTVDGQWSERLQDAVIRHDEEGQAALLATGMAAEESCEIVGPYLMPVMSESGAFVPLSQRERIRALGPSIRRDLGKQASQGDIGHVSI